MQTQIPSTISSDSPSPLEGKLRVRVAALVVLYNPRPELLDRLLQSLAGQVQSILVIDNSPVPSPDLPARLQHVAEVSYRPLGDNTGIAHAQNLGIQQAFADDCTHVLLLDQDSAIPPTMVADLLQAERQLLVAGQPVAAVGPVFRDEKTGELSPVIRHRGLRVRKLKLTSAQTAPVEADYLISSGSLIRSSVLREAGAMREELFIDWVDIEWGLRARAHGLRCFVVPTVIMTHSIGDASVRVLAKNVNLHSDVRHYYIVRNATYLLRLRSMGWSWRLITLFKIPQYVIFYSLHSQRMWHSFRLLLRAVADGLFGRLGRLR